MKLLLLSCGTGEGHNSAANAIREAAQAMGVDCEVKDPVAFGGQRAKAAVDGLYNGMVRKTPKMFGAVYQAGALFERTGLTSPVYFANALYAKKLQAYLREREVSAVVSTHLYGMEAMTAVRRRFGAAPPSFGVLTDYTRIPFFGEPQVDGIFLPHPDLRGELEEKGVPPRRLFPTGIPVSPRFSSPPDKAAARAALGLPQGRRAYLVMTGGVGCGDAGGLCDALLAADGGDPLLLVLTGRNEALRQELAARYRGAPQVRLVPFTKEVPAYMAAADVTLSKPGGLSSTEAAVAGTPLVHVLPIPGCETKNAAFFAQRGMALRAESVQDAAQKAVRLAGDPQAQAAMRASQRANTRPDAAQRIVELAMGWEERGETDRP